MNSALRFYATAGIALVGAGVIAGAPVAKPPPGVHMRDVRLTADEEITLDLVRHGQTVGNNSIVDTGDVPGAALDDTGKEQAQAVAQLLGPEGPYAGIYAGQNIRMPETAQPLADALHTDVQPLLSGLNEIGGGVYAGAPLSGPGGILFELTLAAWAFGFDSVPMPGSAAVNGVVFEDRFNDAVQTIYDNTVSAGGPTKDVAVSGEAAISAWALMNANNPDASIFLPLFIKDLSSGKDILPEGGVVVLRGDPEDGWTLVSWNGTPIPQDPGLLTELIVDVRNLITAPQTATWHIWEAIIGGDPTTIENAIQTGFSQVGAAIVQFPQSVINDIVDALGDGTGAGGQAAGESLGDTLASAV